MSSPVFEKWVYDHLHYRRAMTNLIDAITEAVDDDEPFVSMLLGPSGAGKSALLQDAAASFKARDAVSGRPCVLYVPLPSGCTSESVPKCIIEKIIGDLPVRGTRFELRRMAERMLKQAGVRVLVIDELNHLVEARSSERAQTKENRQLADWFKAIFDQLRISLVLGGLPHCIRLLADNEQLARRAMRPVQLEPYCWHDESDRAAFVDTVKAFVAHLKECGWHINADPAHVIKGAYLCCGGLVGLLYKLFARAARVGRADKVLDLAVLSKAFEMEFHQMGNANPFALTVIPDELLHGAYQRTLQRFKFHGATKHSRSLHT